jgi:hypothetical protein
MWQFSVDALRADVEAICQRYCDTAEVEIQSNAGRLNVCILGRKLALGCYADAWGPLSDAVDDAMRRHGCQFERGEWSLSWDGGAVAEWTVMQSPE